MIRHYTRWLLPRLFWVAFVYTVIWFLSGVFVGRASAQDGHNMGHMLYHEQAYSHWMQPGTTTSCCHAKVRTPYGMTGDCRPTAATLVNGHWRAELDPEEKPGPEKDGWVTIPDSRVIHEINPDPSGVSAHLCYNYGMVYCFVPPFGGG